MEVKKAFVYLLKAFSGLQADLLFKQVISSGKSRQIHCFTKKITDFQGTYRWQNLHPARLKRRFEDSRWFCQMRITKVHSFCLFVKF